MADGDAEWAPPLIHRESAEKVEAMSYKELSNHHRTLAAEESELRDWRAARNALKIEFEVRTYTRR